MPGILLWNRYGLLRRQLVRIEKLHDGLLDDQRAQLAEALSQFRIIEKKIDTARAAGMLGNMDSAKFNEIVSKRIETLESLMIAIKKAGV